MKTSDIPDTAIYEVVAKGDTYRGKTYSAITVSQLETALPNFTYKLILSKVRQMIAKGRLRGCPCGCRGDLRFPWVEFGDPYVAEDWQTKLEEYLKSGKRKYGY